MVKHKIIRRNVRLTDYQIRRLQELSEFDGRDEAEHVRKAIDDYLKNQKFEFTAPKEKDIYVELKARTDDPALFRAVWLSGVVDRYEFSALILNAPSKSGIDKGRISKLSVWDPVVMEASNNFIGSCIVNYDRGWDIRPSTIAEPYYNKVKSLIDNYIAQSVSRDFFQ
ncbi:hypothetical protein [Dyadobacter sp. NIV53]|uniref:DUF7678 domain-containing protein n=1 Tax=Dyadobacter sp. NIV53 TaxID=2861765 RepID=UPI001C86AEDC|nr:hypothetical protein [Dyadobacter sp. NIV53]